MRDLDSLCPRIREPIMRVIARLVEAGVSPCIVDTLRTKAEHKKNLAAGTSWVKRSKHMPNDDCPDCRGLSHAIDLAPYSEFIAHGRNKNAWDASHPHWQLIGDKGEEQGLRWGGRWRTPDLGHLELRGE